MRRDWKAGREGRHRCRLALCGNFEALIPKEIAEGPKDKNTITSPGKAWKQRPPSLYTIFESYDSHRISSFSQARGACQPRLLCSWRILPRRDCADFRLRIAHPGTQDSNVLGLLSSRFMVLDMCSWAEGSGAACSWPRIWGRVPECGSLKEQQVFKGCLGNVQAG
jgi:hypothetical protein